MTDIVERLRVFATQRYDGQLVTEAADEIERLRNSAKVWELIAKRPPDDDLEERGAAGELRAEIEQLRAENEWRRSAAKAWQLIAQTNQELCDEIERLHASSPPLPPPAQPDQSE